MYVDTLTQLENIYLPEPGYKIPSWGHPWYFASLCVAKQKDVVPGKKVWLSRSGLESTGRIVNEAEVELKLLEVGWRIFHPQRFSIEEQIAMLQDASVIAGFQGSAFHTLLFFDVKSRVVIFPRNGPPLFNYFTIATHKHISQDVLDVHLEYVSGERARTVSRLKDPDEILEKIAAY